GREADDAVPCQRGGEPPFRVADRIERAVERKAIEIVGNDDAARGAGDVIETKERRGGEIDRRNLGNILPGALRHHDDVRRGDERRQRGEAARKLVRHALLAQIGLAPRARRRGGRGQRGGERGLDRRNALAIVRDDRGQSLRQVYVAQEPDQTVEQQVLHRLIELELQLAGNLVVERVDRGVERG